MIPITSEEKERHELEGLWSASETLSSLLARHARERPDATAVVDASGLRLTYAELDRAACGLAAALSARGVGVGDAVGMQLPNRAESSVVVAAIEKLGAVTVPLTVLFREHELSYVANKTAMVALVVPGTFRRYDFETLALAVQEGAPTLRCLVSLGGDPAAGLESYATLVQEGVESDAGRDRRFADPEIDPNAIAAILMTSGTEADPKAVIHTNNTLYANARSLQQMLRLDADDHIFMASPVGHGTGLGFGTRLAIYLGSTLVLQDVWEPEAAARMMAAERCRYTHASTTFAQDLLELDGLASHDLSALRYFVTGGAAIPPGFVARIRDAIGCRLLRLYGQTEAFMTTLNRPEDSDALLDSRDGRAVPGVTLQVWGDDDRVLSPGEAGELVCQGPHRCRGFLADEERTARTVTPEGWLRMGDLGVLDEQGYVRIVGRTKEVISRGGYKYSPREVEEMLLDHPSVARVVIVRIPDHRLGERACACVITAGDGELKLEDLTAFLRKRGLAPYKLPERLELMTEFPTTASGKVQKFALERQLAEVAQR